jgi:hypothetical protein
VLSVHQGPISDAYAYDGTSSGRWALGDGLLNSGQQGIFQGGTVLGFADISGVTQYTAIFSGANTSVLRANAGSVVSGTGNIGTSTLSALTVGARYSQNQNLTTGPYCELLIYDRILSSSEISKLESYLTKKWGTP